jgi:hypothetical protein
MHSYAPATSLVLYRELQASPRNKPFEKYLPANCCSARISVQSRARYFYQMGQASHHSLFGSIVANTLLQVLGSRGDGSLNEPK